MSAADHRSTRHQPWLERFSCLALVFAVMVITMGGETTSNGAGMAFQSWPLSNGSLDPAGWLTNYHMFLEHSHRLLAGTTAILTLIAAIWVHFTDARAWVRRLAWILLGVILLQAVLGGMRVLMDPSNTHALSDTVEQIFAVSHATCAEITLVLWVTLAVALSYGWMVRGTGINLNAPAVRRWGHITCAIILLQIIVGAIMRQGGYIFAIPTNYFPFAGPNHALLPPVWSWPVAVNFAHRLGACFVTIALIGLAVSVFRNPAARKQLGSWMALVIIALLAQLFLGSEVIMTNKNPNVATLHLLGGAFLLASTWLLTFISYRSKWWPEDAAVQSASS